ncbi:MAG: recombinase zinc beta ribbon domain-containing protein, partial [Erysipelotrichaceae bacterium]|nr:recombinase zinc beta ribbon domain-containing protein [Erysipelotrichaceae bacterium]
ICAECGSTFKRRIHNVSSNSYYAWTCKKHLDDKDACSMLFLKEEDIKTSFIRMLRKLHAGRDQVLEPFITGLRSNNNKDYLKKVSDLEEKLDKNNEQQLVLLTLLNGGYLETDSYLKERNELLKEAEELTREKEQLCKYINGSVFHLEEARKLMRLVSNEEVLKGFDDDLFLEIVDTITVNTREEITFNLKCGLGLKERVGR